MMVYKDYDIESAMMVDNEASEAEAWIESAGNDLQQAEDNLAMVADSSGDTPGEAQKTDMTTASAWAAQCMLTMRDAKLHMNAVAKSRGHFEPPPSVPHSGYGSWWQE